MKIERKSWLFRYAYFWKKYYGDKIPETVNLCRFFWRVVFVTLENIVMLPFALLFFLVAVVATLAHAVAEIVCFLAGYRYTVSEKWADCPFTIFSPNPTKIEWIPRVGTYRILPVYIIGPLFAVWFGVEYGNAILEFIWLFFNEAERATEIYPEYSFLFFLFCLFATSIVGTLSISGIYFGVRALKRKLSSTLLFLYIKAKKEKVCPIIEFVD